MSARRWPEVDGPRRDFSEGPHVLGAVTLLARLAQELISPRLAELGLTFAQAVAMVRLWQSETGELGQSELIELLVVSRASGSLVLGELEEAGLIERSIDPEDARRQIVRLTPEGRLYQPKVHAAFEEVEGMLFSPVGSEQWWTTYRELRSAIDTAVALRAHRP